MTEPQLHRPGRTGRILVKSGSQTKRVAEFHAGKTYRQFGK
jgi:hypothetical protein